MLFFLFCCCTVAAEEQSVRPTVSAQAESEITEALERAIILPEPVPDPIEAVNRRLWAINKGLMMGAIQPTAKGYRVIIPRPLRTGIRNVGRNIGFPKRIINNLLQKRWHGSRDETFRFLANSVFGLGGLFDVGTRWGIPESEADFGQTFGIWGWKPHAYLMLPVYGPSNERDAFGSALDSLVNPLSYFSPYSYIPYGILYNDLTDTVDEYVRETKASFDPYAVLRYAWTIRRENRGVDMALHGEQDAPSLETLRAVFFTFRDPKFPQRGTMRTVPAGAAEQRLPYRVWVQQNKASLVYIVPGLGSHRLSGGTLALAELLYNEGYSVVAVSSAFNYEFIERGSSVAMPGYTPVDADDLRVALSAIDHALSDEFSDRFTSRVLMGYSMGGFHTLYLAGTESTNALKFERYVAIDSPVHLSYAMEQLDHFFDSALEWKPAERTKQIEQTFLKVAVLSKNLDKLTPESTIPFNSTESKFLIGLAFRLTLRDTIFLSQLRTNQGVLTNKIDTWRREPAYREILQYRFSDYLDKFVAPYYSGRGVDLQNRAQLATAIDLRTRTQELRSNEKIRIIANANDILLGADGLTWMQTTFQPDRVRIFERGGHLGNLTEPEVQRAILDTVVDLKR